MYSSREKFLCSICGWSGYVSNAEPMDCPACGGYSEQDREEMSAPKPWLGMTKCKWCGIKTKQSAWYPDECQLHLALRLWLETEPKIARAMLDEMAAQKETPPDRERG